MKSEASLAEVVVAHFEDEGWEVYQEVLHVGSVADIVITRSGLTGIIECKMGLGLTVIAQADLWRYRANFVWVAIPYKRLTKTNEFGMKLLSERGIGALRVRPSGVHEHAAPSLMRVRPGMGPKLVPEQKTFAKAGTSGSHWTPFKGTCRNLLGIVRGHPEGIEVKAAISQLNHHYCTAASARSCLLKLAEQGVVPGVSVRREGRKVLFVPV